MKKSTLLIIFLLSASFIKLSAQVYYSPTCSASQALNSTAINFDTKATGMNSFAAGNKSTAAGMNSIALGQDCYSVAQSFSFGQWAKANADQSIAIGRFVTTTSNAVGSIVIGNSNSGQILNNEIGNSMMIGFNSTLPIFFASSTQVGIATKYPKATLDVNGTSYFKNNVQMATLITTKGKRVVVTDETGILSFTEDFTGIPGDNLGNHTAQANLNMGDFSIYNGTKDIESSKIGLILTPENNAILSNGNETSFTISSGASYRSSLWLSNDPRSEFGMIVSSDNLSGGIYHNFSDPKAIINFTSSKVGIGVDPIETSAYRLFVEGGILTDEVLIKLESEWFDYVLEEDYELMSLKELEVYIKQHMHLPDIPSANEVKENGIQIGEMNGLLLKKIEELTIHLIEQQKEIDNLKELVISIQNN